MTIYKLGDPVAVIRSNGDLEFDWQFMHYWHSTRCVVTKEGNQLFKCPSVTTFERWQAIGEQHVRLQN